MGIAASLCFLTPRVSLELCCVCVIRSDDHYTLCAAIINLSVHTDPSQTKSELPRGEPLPLGQGRGDLFSGLEKTPSILLCYAEGSADQRLSSVNGEEVSAFMCIQPARID